MSGHTERMSHPEQLGYFAAVAEANQHLIDRGRVLEIGSYDVNGTIRALFDRAAEYVGVDLTPGPGVDRVDYGHEVDDPDATFDVAISGECFEHDPHWRETFANMVRLTRPGGLVAFSCAARGRPEHGTRRTTRDLSPGTQAVGLDYYRNLSRSDLDGLPLDEWFGAWRAWYLPTHFDLYFAGVRRGGNEARLPSGAEVKRLADLMPAAHRVARLPLRLLSRTGVSEAVYQNAVTPYWNLLLRAAGDEGTR